VGSFYTELLRHSHTVWSISAAGTA